MAKNGLNGASGIGRRQKEILALLYDTWKEMSESGPRECAPPWRADGWIRLKRRWVILTNLEKRGLVEVMTVEGGHAYAPPYQTWTIWLVRLTAAGEAVVADVVA